MVCNSITSSIGQFFNNDSNDIKYRHGKSHADEWDAEEGVKLARVKSEYLTSLILDLYMTESEIKIFKIDIDNLSNEIEQLVIKIVDSYADHGLAHEIDNTVQAVSNLNIFEDTKLIDGDNKKQYDRYIDLKHEGQYKLIVDCYQKRTKKFQLEMDLKKKQYNIEPLRGLIRLAEKEVADDSICERENNYAVQTRKLIKLHTRHTTYDYEKIYKMRNNPDSIKELLENYKKIVADALTI